MSLLATGWIVAASICVALSVLQLLIWLRRRSEVSYLIFSVATLAAAGVALAEIRMSGATSVEGYISAFRLANYCVAALFIALAWFVVTYSDSERRRLAWIATAGWSVCALINLARPTGLALAEVSGLAEVTTAWGETYTVAVARTDATKLLADLSALVVLLLALLTFLSMRRAGQRHRGAILGAISLFLGLALVHTTLVDLGLLSSPYLISFFFLAIALVTSYQLAAEVARASVLSEKVRSDEHRWRTLLEGVDLLVLLVRFDGFIDYVNPHLGKVSGYEAAELVGEHVRTLLPEDEQERILARLADAARGDLESRFESLLKTKQGEHRTIVWRNVPFRATEAEPLEVLSVGVDITSRKEAEAARDLALSEIEALKSQLEEENLYLKQEIRLEGEFSEIIGESEALKYVLFRIEQVASTDTTVLIQGETGVGKELVARAIHDRSQRSQGAFVRLNCAALPANLVESELFGHVAGAFTDARTRRVGRFELANRGTLLLDEVSELPLDLQPKLLRVLQDGEFEPVGSSETRRTDVRLLAATNRNLELEVEQGRFREDLFYRLHVYPITVPPLRDRKEDLPLLIEHFLPYICTRVGRTVCEVPSRVVRTLQAYSWPGNVRQLQNVLEESVVISTGGTLRLPAQFDSTTEPDPAPRGFRTLEETERNYIRRVLESTNGQIAGAGGAAEILDLHPNTLRSRMKKLGLSSKQVSSYRA